jgi:hypothetical protein
MSLPKGTRAKVEWVVTTDKAIIFHWDGYPVPADVPLRGTKMGIVAWTLNFAFSENRVTKEFMSEWIKKAVKKNIIGPNDLELFLNGQSGT